MSDKSAKKQLIPYSSIVGDPKNLAKASGYRFDDQGIIQLNFGEDIGFKYSPTVIATYALSNFIYYQRTEDESYRSHFLKHVDYLRSHHDILSDELIAFPNPFPWKYYQLEAGWYSGLTQAYIISLFIRSYEYLKDESLHNIIVKIYKFMTLSAANGGLLRFTPEGDLWIEEYPTESPSLVLNGFVTCVISIYEYCWLFPNDKAAATIFQQSLYSLKRAIPYYDTGSWLKYDRVKESFYVSRDYAEYQVLQMKHLYEITNDVFFQDTAIRWSSYLDRHYVYRTQKNAFVNSMIERMESNKSILIYGSGEHTQKLLELTNLSDKQVIGIVESVPNQTKFMGYEVFDPQAIQELSPDIIVISSMRYQEEINSIITKYDFKGKIVKFYSKSDFLPFY